MNENHMNPTHCSCVVESCPGGMIRVNETEGGGMTAQKIARFSCDAAHVGQSLSTCMLLWQKPWAASASADDWLAALPQASITFLLYICST